MLLIRTHLPNSGIAATDEFDAVEEKSSLHPKMKKGLNAVRTSSPDTTPIEREHHIETTSSSLTEVLKENNLLKRWGILFVLKPMQVFAFSEIRSLSDELESLRNSRRKLQRQLQDTDAAAEKVLLLPIALIEVERFFPQATEAIC